MPKPTEERVSQLVAGLVERRGFDLEGVEISTAGTRLNGPAGERDDQTDGRTLGVQVIVDSDGGSDLDALALLSTELSELLDEAGDFGESGLSAGSVHARHRSPVDRRPALAQGTRAESAHPPPGGCARARIRRFGEVRG